MLKISTLSQKLDKDRKTLAGSLERLADDKMLASHIEGMIAAVDQIQNHINETEDINETQVLKAIRKWNREAAEDMFWTVGREAAHLNGKADIFEEMLAK